MNLETLFDRFARTVEERGLHVEGIAAADEKKLLLERHFAPDRPRNIYSHIAHEELHGDGGRDGHGGRPPFAG